MAAMTDLLETALLNATLRNTAYSSPATVYTALTTTATTDAGGGTEVSGGSYARVATTFGAPSGGICSNSEVVFPQATANWGTITHLAITSHISTALASVAMYHGALTASKLIENTDTFRLPAAAFTVQLA